MNSIHNETLTWIGDGSDGNTLTQTANDLIIASKSPGTPFNLVANSDKASEPYYWQATIQKLTGNISMGAVSKDEFKPGWKVKGMFYNGNLTNGTAALKVNWGPRFAAGDTIGVRVTPGSQFLEVSFYKNGECLGTGFHLSNNNTTTYYPCLHISGSAQVHIETPPDLPSTELSAPTVTGLYGNWKMDKAWDGENPVMFPDVPITLELAGDGNHVTIYFKVANNVGGSAQIVEQTDTALTVKTGPFMMTRMMPPPEYQPLESLLGSKEITHITLEEHSKLTVSGPEMKTGWSRLVRAPLPLTTY